MSVGPSLTAGWLWMRCVLQLFDEHGLPTYKRSNLLSKSALNSGHTVHYEMNPIWRPEDVSRTRSVIYEKWQARGMVAKRREPSVSVAAFARVREMSINLQMFENLYGSTRITPEDGEMDLEPELNPVQVGAGLLCGVAVLSCQCTAADETGKPVLQLKPKPKPKQVSTACHNQRMHCFQGKYEREPSISLATLRSQLTSVPDDEETDAAEHKEPVDTRNRNTSLVGNTLAVSQTLDVVAECWH